MGITSSIFGENIHLKVYIALLAIMMIVSHYVGVVFLVYFFSSTAIVIMLFRLIKAYLSAKEQRTEYVLISLAIISYIIADLSWYVNKYVLFRAYAEYEFLQIAFLLPTILILSATIINYAKKLEADARAQKYIIANDIVSIYLMTIIFTLTALNEIDTKFIYSSITNFSGYLNIVLSFMILFLLFCVIFSSEFIVINKSGFYAILGAGVYACVRITYSYQVLTEFWYDSIFLNILFLFAFFLFLLGAFELNGVNKKIKARNLNGAIKWLPLLCIFPLAFKGGFNAKLSFFILLILVAHTLISYYIRSNLRTKNMLEKEREIHKDLELEVSRYVNELKLSNFKLKDMIEKDYLTGIGSRAFLMDSLSKILPTLKHDAIVVYYINLRRFRLTNVSYGHEIGDKILCSVAKKLDEMTNESDFVCRFGADEFILVRRVLEINSDECIKFAKSIIAKLSEGILVSSYQFSIECAIGIECATAGKFSDAKELIKNADKAMNFAKQDNKYNPFMYSAQIDSLEKRKAQIEILAHQAVFERDFEVYYQPVFETNSKKLVSAEVLLRWNNIELGFLEASNFMDVVKKGETISKIYEFVLTSVAKDISELIQNDIKAPCISINVASRQTSTPEFINTTKRIMQQYNVPLNMIELEMDEAVWMNDESVLDDIFKRISDTGMSVCIDDFGTGYSSLVYVKKYDVNRIKIAKDLIVNIANSEPDTQIVRAIVELAKIMNIKSVAKGIENEDILNKLAKTGCDEMQGFALKRPMSASDFKKSFIF
ncbi:putative bifunctional diguanylate cyclase/phosphodiesterase [Campylobacter mucosalis]|uniref:putative bifunctional diguanylate cyclase/phosphodiesterase n=1 Tax=Campylobacter mucosalis TaxID=202 RepID=UPI00146FF908|nr:bifunctional diguanylate cyclase/phosphodiesterase [Campylobacter mucosalis]